MKSEDAREALFEITKDSDNHKEVLRKIISNIKDFNLEKTLSDLSLKDVTVDFKGKIDGEIFQEIYESEKKAFQLYSTITEKTEKNLIGRLWLEERPKDFFDTINWLISEEKKHMDLVYPFSMGRIERIR